MSAPVEGVLLVVHRGRHVHLVDEEALRLVGLIAFLRIRVRVALVVHHGVEQQVFGVGRRHLADFRRVEGDSVE